MSRSLDGRTLIVSGGGGSGRRPYGVGEAVCMLCGALGARVVVANRNAGIAEASAARIRARGGVAAAAVADLAQEAECLRVVAETVSRFGPIDGLVGNVAITEGAPVPDTDEAGFDRVMATNAKSLLFLAKHALPFMGSGGAIVAVSSIVVARPAASTAYGASKGALEALAAQIAWDQGERGIRANVVRVGDVWTPMAARNCPDAAARRARRSLAARRTVLGRVGTAEDVAEAVAFLLGPRARWITGQVLTVDGGASLIRPDPAWRERRHVSQLRKEAA